MLVENEVRRLALGLAGAVEQDHHGRPSFRVAQKIFATLPDPEHVNVMLDEDDILLATQHPSGCCSPVYWGSRLAALHVDLRLADAELVAELLSDAWARRAPRRVRSR